MAHLIPLGKGQRSDAEANRLVEWLLVNGIEVGAEQGRLHVRRRRRSSKGSYIVDMTQAHRGLANTALGIGDDVSASITQLYAPPGAWSHGYLWGADIVTIPRNADFHSEQREIKKPAKLSGGVDRGKADRYVLEIDSATAVRALNELVGSGVAAQIALAAFTGPADARGRERSLRRRSRHEGDARRARQGAGPALPARARRVAARLDAGRSRAADRRPDGRGQPGRLVAAEPRLHGRSDLDRDDQHRPHRSARGLRRRLQHGRLAFGREPAGTDAADGVLRRAAAATSAPARTAATS